MREAIVVVTLSCCEFRTGLRVLQHIYIVMRNYVNVQVDI